jgi:hypothetical protein
MNTTTYPHRQNYRGLLITAVLIITQLFMLTSDLCAQTESVNSRVNVGIGRSGSKLWNIRSKDGDRKK